MLLFSKRNTEKSLLRVHNRAAYWDDEAEDKSLFLQEGLRTRLQEFIRYVIQSGEYLEPFLIVTDEEKRARYLHKKTIDEYSRRELGYAMSDLIDCEKLTFDKDEYKDIRLFDLIEAILIFSTDSKRADLTARFAQIFLEEKDKFILHGFMIVDKGTTGLASLIPLIQDDILKGKLKELYVEVRPLAHGGHEASARLSADIIQFLFSSPAGQTATRSYSEELCKEIAQKWTTADNIERLATLLSETIQNAKDLSNQIANIRHTDQHTIRVATPSFYKIVAHKNMSLIELVVLSLPEKYVVEQNPEDLKSNYLTQFGINKDNGWVVAKKEPAFTYPPLEEIKPEDIPF